MASFSKRSLSAVSVSLVAVATILGTQPIFAQGGGGGFPGRPSIGAQSYNACIATDYGAVAAKALGLTEAVLRKDLVAGQSLQDIATTANVDLATVTTAVAAARKPDIDAAVAAGVLTQAEGTALEATPDPNATRPASGGGNGGGPRGTQGAPGGGNGRGGGLNGTQAIFPDISTFAVLLRNASGGTPAAPGAGGGRGGFAGGFGGGFGGVNIGSFNLVKQYAVVATALNMKCTDLVTTLITPPGTSVVALGTKQNVDQATIAAALTKAYTDALAQDVTDGVITQDQATTLTPSIATAVTAFINNPLPMGQQGTPAAQAQQANG